MKFSKALAAVSAVTFISAQRDDDCRYNSYTKFQDGNIIYGMNDGGCFSCARAVGAPLSGVALSETCQQMCDSDPTCLAYEVSRTAALPAYEYVFGGETMNCCLERSVFPSAIFVDATNHSGSPDTCQLDTLCWTRYEKKDEEHQDGLAILVSTPGCDGESIPPPSDLCTEVTSEMEFSDEDIQGQMDFIAGGCNYNDAIFEYLLAQAHIECNAEIKTESQTTSTIAPTPEIETESETASAIAPTPEIETESETASAIAPTPKIETESETASAIAPTPEIETESETASAIAPTPKVDTESETPSTIAPTPEIETESETPSAIALTPEIETESETASAIALMPGLCLLELAALSLHSFGII